MNLTVSGRDYDFDLERIGIDELREMHRKYKLTLKTLMPAVAEFDPDALTCFWWLLNRQNGAEFDRVPLNDDLDFDVMALLAALNEPADDDGEQEEEPDPTQVSSSPTGSAASRAPSGRKATTRPPRGGQHPAGSPSGSGQGTSSS